MADVRLEEAIVQTKARMVVLDPIQGRRSGSICRKAVSARRLQETDDLPFQPAAFLLSIADFGLSSKVLTAFSCRLHCAVGCVYVFHGVRR